MGRWYRVMVVFTALAAVLCTSAVIFAGARLSRVRLAGWTLDENSFVWQGGAYYAEGTLSERGLESLTIQRRCDAQ